MSSMVTEQCVSGKKRVFVMQNFGDLRLVEQGSKFLVECAIYRETHGHCRLLIGSDVAYLTVS